MNIDEGDDNRFFDYGLSLLYFKKFRAAMTRECFHAASMTYAYFTVQGMLNEALDEKLIQGKICESLLNCTVELRVLL